MSGQVYKLICPNGVYYGSTTESLSARLRKHKYHAKKYPDRPVYKAWGDTTIQIVCLEIAPVEELRSREDFYIRSHVVGEPATPLLNVNHAVQTQEDKRIMRKAYYQSHYEEERAYRESHKAERAVWDKTRDVEKKRDYQRAYRERMRVVASLLREGLAGASSGDTNTCT